MVSEKFSPKNLFYRECYRECMAHILFCHTTVSQFLVADISLNIACKALKIAQTAQLNQLFQLLHLVTSAERDVKDSQRSGMSQS